MRILFACALPIGLLSGLAMNVQPQGKAEVADLCRLQADPASYNHKLIQVTARVSHGFEHFTMSDARCSSSSIWLDYGGTVNSDTIFCCGSAAGAARGATLVVEGVTIPLVTDALFRRFDARVRQGGTNKDVTFRATVQGRFFAGEKQRLPDGREVWAGYGHFGCCSLLVIQQVLAVEGGSR
jgi:hypothetical protein